MNYSKLNKEELLEEVSKRPHLQIDAPLLKKEELIDILEKDDEKLNPPPNTKTEDDLKQDLEWEKEIFKTHDSVIANGYAGVSGGVRIRINPGEIKKTMTSSGVANAMVAGSIFVNDKSVEKITGLNKDAVWTLVHAKVIVLSKEQEQKFISTFYKK